MKPGENFFTTAGAAILCLLLGWAIGSLIAWDYHPRNWWLLGRIIYVIWVVLILSKASNDFDI